ncbi:odorant receptor 46a-like [Copidosoma floridanum]|uniref:odorant receptor 46a-like n=1 Tax=Copidosoma floridanum TaxID=29053 RepID=UPI0006C9914B|nr:odorant receptor 46a-like [Copidosoma floridanum]
MEVLPCNFRCCQIFGLWYESSSYAVLKKMYRSAVLVIIFQFIIGEIIELFLMEGDVGEFTELLYLACTFGAFGVKLLNFMARREKILDLLEDFKSQNYQAKSPQELQLYDKYRRTAKLIFLCAFAACSLTGGALCFLPLIVASENKQLHLPLRYLQFWDTSNNVCFWISYALKILSVVCSVPLNVSMDTLIYGFLILSTGQFQMNSCRFRDGQESMKSCLNHYLMIVATVKKIQNFFVPVMLPLLLSSFITLCTSIFEVSRRQVGSFDFLLLSAYLVCMLFQIFFYCYFGNELQVQSQAVPEAVYCSNWIDRTREERKNLWLVMLFAQRGCDISFHGQCKLSLNTFTSVVKTSYAALNLLKK